MKDDSNLYPEEAEQIDTFTRTEIDSIFNRAFNGQLHILTPWILRRGKQGKYLYELSKGESIFKDDLFGVTVLTLDGEKTRLSTSFNDLKAAEDYIKLLRDEP